MGEGFCFVSYPKAEAYDFCCEILLSDAKDANTGLRLEHFDM